MINVHYPNIEGPINHSCVYTLDVSLIMVYVAICTVLPCARVRTPS